MAIPDSFPAVRLPKLHPKHNHEEMDRTIERRLILSLHLVEKSIPRFRIDHVASDGKRRTSFGGYLATSVDQAGDAVIHQVRSRGRKAPAK
jgi:hypothetical protein